ncbi:Phosphonopyruvate decarboxylase [Rhodospirillaceae bacterium LM-1]|nr:Phosphonopyruvate decarboxylase [Rhodospirillaceae bacterium LM-1]
MIKAEQFLSQALQKGIGFYTGVPCSFLTPLINRVISDRSVQYVGAASEGEAVAIAAGAWLAGRETAVICQNSGLGNTVNPLTSLNWPFRIPTLMIVTWRGQPGLKDEPQHELMGEITAGLLDVMRVPHRPFPTDPDDIAPALEAAHASMSQTGLPFAFIMAKDSVADEALNQPQREIPPPGIYADLRALAGRASRVALLERMLAAIPPQAAVVATTGKCGRELFTLADREQHLYQVGSMGGASAMGLGVALNSKHPVIVLDGDGSALMKMGNFATIGAYRPDNLIHIIFDNGVHDSTGGQMTVSDSVDFAKVALASGYARAATTDDAQGFDKAFKAAQQNAGPQLIHARIQPGSMDKLGRPTVKPPEVARRFKAFLQATSTNVGQS